MGVGGCRWASILMMQGGCCFLFLFLFCLDGDWSHSSDQSVRRINGTILPANKSDSITSGSTLTFIPIKLQSTLGWINNPSRPIPLDVASFQSDPVPVSNPPMAFIDPSIQFLDFGGFEGRRLGSAPSVHSVIDYSV